MLLRKDMPGLSPGMSFYGASVLRWIELRRDSMKHPKIGSLKGAIGIGGVELAPETGSSSLMLTAMGSLV